MSVGRTFPVLGSIEDINVAISSVCSNYHWPPSVIRDMYLDDIDYEGIGYHYNDICEMVKEYEKLKPKK